MACVMTRLSVWVASACLLIHALPAAAQPQSVLPPGVVAGSVSPDDAAMLSDGWRLLATGDAAGAVRLADNVLGRAPRSVAAIALAIEATIAAGTSAAALSRYEQWLGGRMAEQPELLRTIARALLVEIAGQPQNPRGRAAALQALSSAGETLIIEDLAKKAAAGGLRETVALASTGHGPSIQILIAELGGGRANKLEVIEALGASKSPAAVPALTRALAQEEPVVRDAAADALGALGQATAIPALKTALGGPNIHLRQKAAAALFKLGDESGVPLLRQLATSPHANQRLMAAQGLAARPDAAWLSLVRPLLNDPDPDVRVGAAQVLAPLDPASALPAIQNAMNDANPAIRDQATLLMVTEYPQDLAGLRGWMKSADRIVRIHAAGRILLLTQ
jgi:hypothetical protein